MVELYGLKVIVLFTFDLQKALKLECAGQITYADKTMGVRFGAGSRSEPGFNVWYDDHVTLNQGVEAVPSLTASLSATPRFYLYKNC